MMTKFIYLYDRCFESNRNVATEYVKTVKIPRFPGFIVIFVHNCWFSSFFFNFSNSRFFQVSR